MKNAKDKTYIVPISCREKKTPLTLHRTIWEKPRHGIECIFIQLTKKVGIKIFPDQETAEVTWGRQKKADKAKIAPRVLSPIMLCDYKNICEIDKETWKGYKFRGKVDVRRQPCYFFKTQVAEVKIRGEKTLKYTWTEKRLLMKSLESIDLSAGDLHNGNIGRVNGRLVCIDFGPEST